MKNQLIATLFCLIASNLSAQMAGGVKFDKIEHNFGDIKSEEGTVTAVFEYTNIANVPIYISKVETSCGCTTPEYNKDTIQPGQKGFVKAIYEARGHRGNFHKNIFVYFNTQDYYQSLSITGNVIPEANLSKRPASYTTTYSNLALNSTIASFPDLKSTEKKTYVIKAFNYMGYDMKIWEVREVPDYATVEIGDSTIKSTDSLYITFTVDGTKISHLGESWKRIMLVTDDPSGETKFLNIYVNLKEDFSKMSKQELKNAPVIQLDSANGLNYGKCQAGSIVKKQITITNNGKTDLKIRNIKPSCSCVTFQLSKTTLKPGESVTFTIIIDTVNQTIATHSKYITLYTNDPKKSEINIKLIINITS
ncbi:MAG: DUF1573 domain-containing protein [Bacteroidia bacterium]|nr:DUF1573 domain-containing protein [Bacteroidia bacterium]